MCGRLRYSSTERVSDSDVSLLNWCRTTAEVASRSFSDRNWK